MMKKLKFQWCCLFHIGKWEGMMYHSHSWCPTCREWRR